MAAASMASAPRCRNSRMTTLPWPFCPTRSARMSACRKSPKKSNDWPSACQRQNDGDQDGDGQARCGFARFPSQARLDFVGGFREDRAARVDLVADRERSDLADLRSAHQAQFG